MRKENETSEERKSHSINKPKEKERIQRQKERMKHPKKELLQL
jgi:hypothetical protein